MEWSCGRCTLLNQPKAATCEACLAQRPPVRVALSGQTITQRIAERQRAKKQEEDERKALLRVVAEAEAAEEGQAIFRAVAESEAAERREVGLAEEQCTLKEFLEDQSCETEVPSWLTTASTMSQTSTWERPAPDWEMPPTAPVFKPDKRHGIGTLHRPMPPVVYNKVGSCPKCRHDLVPEQSFCGCGTAVSHLTASKNPKRKTKVSEAWGSCVPDATPWRSVHDPIGPPGYTPAEPEIPPISQPMMSVEELTQSDTELRENDEAGSDSSEELFPSSSRRRIKQYTSAPEPRKTLYLEEASTLSLKDLYAFFGGASVIILVGLPQSGKSILADALGKHAGYTVVRKLYDQDDRGFVKDVEKQFKKAANVSRVQLKWMPPRFVIDAENIREKQRQAIWRVVVDKHRINPLLVKFLVLVPTRQTCRQYIERLMTADDCSYDEAEKLIRSAVKKFDPLNRGHLTMSTSILTLLNNTESGIVRAFVKDRLAEVYNETVLLSPKSIYA